jgi:hypothetical protein
MLHRFFGIDTRSHACHAADLPLDFDLFSACVFCASSLFSADLRPLHGFSGDLSGGYTTFQRRNSVSATGDTSDVTAKFVSAGFDWNRPAGAGLGAGTPASELKLRVIFPNAHDESSEDDTVPDRVIATGDWRYENISVVGRYALAPRTSLETGFLQRLFKGTDLVNVGGPFLQFSEQRQLVAERDDYAIGLRQRWEGFEIAAHWKHPVMQGSFNTMKTYIFARGHLDGASLELKTRQGKWSGSVVIESVGGHLDVEGQFLPTTVSSTAWMSNAQVRLSYSFGSCDVFAAALYDESRLPFVSLAPLGAETRAFDSGYVADSKTREWHLELAFRVKVTAGFLPRIFFRSSTGTETVSLRDAAGSRPGMTLNVDRGGAFRSFLMGLSAEFTIGGAPAVPPASP